MKNIFDYANKELSQDAFLRWLFESYSDDDLYPIVKALLGEFCSLEDDEQILDVKTWTQWVKIDLTVYIDTNKRKLALFIEDKTFSGEHNQLLRYNKKIDTIKERKTFKIFYKTSLLTEWDKKAVKEAGWRHYDICSLFNIYENFKNTSNAILKCYIEYLERIEKAVKNVDKPRTNDSKIDYLKWESYFNKCVLPYFIDKYPKSVVYKGRYSYVYLQIRIDDGLPYLEVRSRDCTNDRLMVKILCYDAKDCTNRNLVINEIKKDTFFNCKGIRGKNPKQIGKYSSKNIDSNEKFIKEIEKCVSKFPELIKLW